MYKVAITGGIGAGKSTVSKLFDEIGVPIFNSDLCAREAEQNSEVKNKFKEILGSDVFNNDILDRKKIRAIIFKDKEKLKQVTQVITPYVEKSFNDFVNKNRKYSYVILESAILFETNKHNDFNAIITVTANINKRRERVLKRDKITIEEFNDKINNQLPDDVKILKSDFVILNNGNDMADSLDYLTEQVYKIDKILRGYQIITSGISKF